MNEMLAVATITVLAVISPGPDFAMITRNSYAYGRGNGLMAALGIACGVQVHVLYTVLGIAVLVAASPPLLTVMKTLGALYLCYLGVSAWRSPSALRQGEATRGQTPSLLAAFRTGFLTNALNPKTMLFVVATYTQLATPHNGGHPFAYGFFMSFTHWLWFSLVALFFSAEALRQRLLRHQRLLDRAIGAVLLALGLGLLAS